VLRVRPEVAVVKDISMARGNHNYSKGSWPSYYPYRNDTQNESDKGFWEQADRVKDLKVLEILREMQRDIVTIMQQNNQIIALLVSFFNARPG
jgi:Txe/YoeB family toxin of Txe-Axe toxin-antitoxin module